MKTAFYRLLNLEKQNLITQFKIPEHFIGLQNQEESGRNEYPGRTNLNNNTFQKRFKECKDFKGEIKQRLTEKYRKSM